MHSLIKPEDTWLLLGFLTGWAAASIYLEQKYRWAAKISGAVIALFGALILANLNIIPTESDVYDAVWTYAIPLAIPMLLFQADLKRIWRESGRMIVIFLMSSFGTVIGVYLAFLALKDRIPHLDKIGAMMTGSYIGGSVNFAALSAKFETPGELVSATVVADNVMMAVYFFVLMAIPAFSFFRKHYPTPHIDAFEREAGKNPDAAPSSFWRRKEISLKDIAFTFASASVIAAVSFKLAEIFDGLIPSGDQASFLMNTLNGMFGDKYLMLTTVTVIAVTVFRKFFGNLRGAQEIGTFLIYLFFVVIGVPASVPLLLKNAPLLMVFVFIIVFVNMAVTLIAGKWLKFTLEEALLATNATIGGPTTAAAMAAAKGWDRLIVPALLAGIFGYMIGNYAGSMMGYFLHALL